MYFPTTPVQSKSQHSKFSPQTAAPSEFASQNYSPSLRSSKYSPAINRIRSSFDFMISETQNKQADINRAVSDVHDVNEQLRHLLAPKEPSHAEVRSAYLDENARLRAELEESLRENVRLRAYINELQSENQRLRGGRVGVSFESELMRELARLKQEGEHLRQDTVLLLKGRQ